MQSVDATCTVCGAAIRWAAGAEPRKCDKHKGTPVDAREGTRVGETLTAPEQAKAIVRKEGF